MIDRVIDQIIESLQDHQPIIAEFSARLQPLRDELIAGWTKAHREIVARGTLSADAIALASPEEFGLAFIDDLRRGDLRQTLSRFARWSQRLALAGWQFDLALKLLREYQHATLGLVLRLYADDPRLALALNALDDLFDGAISVLGAGYVEATHQRVASAARLQVLGQLTSGTAHALNNLLAAVHGRTQFLLERVTDPEIRDELLEIQQTAGLGGQMVRRLQEFERGDSSNKRAVNVNALLRDAAEVTRFLWRDQAEMQGIVIDVVKDFADVPPALAQPAELRHALVALLLNAIDAMPSGGSITLRTERKGSAVLVSIIDNGEGMSDDARARASEPFFSTKALPHLGLGLSIAAKIIADQNGTLAIETKPGRGTLATIALPIAQASVESKGAQPVSAKQFAMVLIIDNEPSVRNLLARLLKMEGHQVTTADRGPEGIAAFKKGNFDIVFTDLGMPEMSGWEVAREIKKINPKPMVVLTTGWPIEMSSEELAVKGIDRVVAKPFDMPVLFGLIKQALAEK